MLYPMIARRPKMGLPMDNVKDHLFLFLALYLWDNIASPNARHQVMDIINDSTLLIKCFGRRIHVDTWSDLQ